MLRNRSPEGSRAHSDLEVGAHYEDRTRAAGIGRLYDAPTHLGEFYRDRMRRVGELLQGVEGDLLDAGCGTGQMIRFLRDSRPGAFALTGLDRSESMIAEARSVLGDSPTIRLVTARVEQLPFDSDTFDVVLAMGVLEYVASVDEAVREIARVTRPGGLTIVTMQNPRSPYRLWDGHVWSRFRRHRGHSVSPIVGCLRESQLRRAHVAAGLMPLSVVYYNLNLLLPPVDALFPRTAIRLQRGLDAVARGPLRRIAADYLMVARRLEEPSPRSRAAECNEEGDLREDAETDPRPPPLGVGHVEP